ncbi:MAG TPA: MraY family glycosyltransferase [Solirubrobacterales bacterium]|nr:MraY family glycosyltransferase [Solirubrobacterales bacterium]
MSDGARLVGAFAVALALSTLATPLMRGVAVRTGFYDEPLGYKRHLQPTPYLGGAAVVAGFLSSGLLFASGLPHLAVIMLAALALFGVGTIDDRVALGVLVRLGAQVAAALALWSAGVRWELTDAAAFDLLVTVVWVVGVVNAFNLMDNLDGAAATVAGVSALGTGTVAVSQRAPEAAALAFALAGACAAFLRFNLAKPARIFLGDGGSMPIGLAAAAVVMSCPHGSLGWASLPALAPLAGLPIFDTTLVVVSRYRRRAPILSGGRDHLTHRLLPRLGSERSVALVVGAAQGLLCLLALALVQSEQSVAVTTTAAYLTFGLIAIAALDGAGSRRARSATGVAAIESIEG